MAQGVDMLETILDLYSLEKKEAGQYSPLNLAFIGDTVFDMVVRTVLVESANRPVNILQKKASGVVMAKAQARMADALMDTLSEEERNIFRRGKNAKPATKAKNASYPVYLKATGLEAVIGYLFLKGETERAVKLIKTGMDALETEEDPKKEEAGSKEKP